jgi:hypothetical protein
MKAILQIVEIFSLNLFYCIIEFFNIKMISIRVYGKFVVCLKKVVKKYWTWSIYTLTFCALYGIQLTCVQRIVAKRGRRRARVKVPWWWGKLAENRTAQK